MVLGKDVNVLNILIDHYGDRDTWETDHLKHYHAMEMFLAVYINENIVGSYIEYKNKFIVHPMEYIDLAKEKSESSHSRLNNIDLKTVLDTTDLNKLEDELRAIKEDNLFADLLLNDSRRILDIAMAGDVRNDWNKQKVGRPSSNQWLYEYMDYLLSELSTINKTVNYVVDHPICKCKSVGTVKREYRKYRNRKKEG